MKSTKQSIRTHVKTLRSKLSETQIHHAAIGVWLQLMNQSFFKSAKNIACYMPMNNELDTKPILQSLNRMDKNTYLPVIGKNQRKLSFYRYTLSQKMHRNQYGIIEPVTITNDCIPPEKLDLVLMPLVAFDDNCHRLGMGKGYYDQTFAFCKSSPKPLLVGIAYPFQNVYNLPTDEFDVDMDYVITNQQVYKKPEK